MEYKFEVSFLSKDMSESWVKKFYTYAEANQCYNDNRAKAKYISLTDLEIQRVF